MRHKRFIFVFIISTIFILLLAGCDSDDDDGAEVQSDQQFTVGVVNIASILAPVVDGLELGMSENGYVEGENVTYIYDGPVSRDDLAATIDGLIEQGVDVIVSLTTPATVAVMEATAENQVPVVFVPVNDPVGAGIVTDVTQPGGNITGIISGQSESRRFEWLLTVTPNIEQVYYPYNPDDSSPTQTLETLTAEIAPQFEVEIVAVEAPDEDAVRAAIENIPEGIDAIYLPSDARVGALLSEWIARSIELGIPISGSSLAHVEAGALSSFSYSPFEAGRQSARLVSQILQGANPGDLPIETAEPVFSINLITAETIGLEITDEILLQSNVIIRPDTDDSEATEDD